MVTVEEVRDQVRSLIPRRIESLDLEFFHDDIRQVDNYIVIGRDSDMEFRVDVATGRVDSVATTGAPMHWFVNSGVRELAACLEVHEGTRELEDDCRDDEHKWQAALHIMLADVSKVDSLATAVESGWWPALAESLMICI